MRVLGENIKYETRELRVQVSSHVLGMSDDTAGTNSAVTRLHYLQDGPQTQVVRQAPRHNL